MKNKLSQISVALGLCLLFIFTLFWYLNTTKPLSSLEVAAFMDKISSQDAVFNDQRDLAQLREFLASDDGRSFYTVNLYEFNESAIYADKEENISGLAAFDRFSPIMIKLLLQHGSHPIFGSNWFEKNTSNWDKLVIVRYRSRRDIAEIFASDRFTEIRKHKWAAIKKNERFIVKGLHITELNVILFIGIFFCAFVLVRKLTKKKLTY